MAASGALAWDGRGWPWEWPLRWTGLLDPELFTIVVKTLTRQPRTGNLRWSHPWSVVKNKKAGVVNAIGLTNPGIDWWIEKIAPRIPEKYKLIASIEANDEKDTVEMVQKLQGTPVLGVELNFSCPNTPDREASSAEKITKIARHAARVSSLPILIKLSYTHDYLKLAKDLETDPKIEAVSINSIPWNLVYPETPSPLARYGGGGVSGKIIQSFTWKMVQEISTISRIPVIGPSVWEYEDVERLKTLGARAISFGSVFVRHPWRPTSYVRRWIREHNDAGNQKAATSPTKS